MKVVAPVKVLHDTLSGDMFAVTQQDCHQVTQKSRSMSEQYVDYRTCTLSQKTAFDSSWNMEHACQINEMQAAMSPDAGHIVQPIHNDGQNTV